MSRIVFKRTITPKKLVKFSSLRAGSVFIQGEKLGSALLLKLSASHHGALAVRLSDGMDVGMRDDELVINVACELTFTLED